MTLQPSQRRNDVKESKMEKHSRWSMSKDGCLPIDMVTHSTRYYNIITDNYEQGWGRYFHYCRFPVSNLPIRAMMARNNQYVFPEAEFGSLLVVLRFSLGKYYTLTLESVTAISPIGSLSALVCASSI